MAKYEYRACAQLYYCNNFKNEMAGIRIRTFLTCILFIYSKNVCVFWPLLWSEISRAIAEMFFVCSDLEKQTKL